MRYKIFLSDFDGTLVREDGTISKNTVEAIKAYRRRGGIFAVCTGRMLSSILPRLSELGITDGIVIAYQGATVADVKTGKLLKNDCFPAGSAEEVVKLLEKEDRHIHVYTDEGMFCNRDDELLKAYEKVCGVKGMIKEEPLSEWLEREKPPVVKVLAMLDPQEKFALRARLQQALGSDFYVTCSSDWLVEVMPAGQSKGAAVQFICDYYGVKKEDTAAIGDQLNDLPMLDMAGGKFTVANGVEELKKIARVMPSNEEDGVAAALKYVMEEEI